MCGTSRGDVDALKAVIWRTFFLAMIAVATRGQSIFMCLSFFWGGGAFFVFLVFFLLTVLHIPRWCTCV